MRDREKGQKTRGRTEEREFNWIWKQKITRMRKKWNVRKGEKLDETERGCRRRDREEEKKKKQSEWVWK